MRATVNKLLSSLEPQRKKVFCSLPSRILQQVSKTLVVHLIDCKGGHIPCCRQDVHFLRICTSSISTLCADHEDFNFNFLLTDGEMRFLGAKRQQKICMISDNYFTRDKRVFTHLGKEGVELVEIKVIDCWMDSEPRGGEVVIALAKHPGLCYASRFRARGRDSHASAFRPPIAISPELQHWPLNPSCQRATQTSFLVKSKNITKWFHILR